jgi:hypothetical protein
MFAIARFRTPISDEASFRLDAQTALDALASCDGYLYGEFAKNTDEGDLWALVTCWSNVGSYRRALGALRVKMEAVPLLARAIDEPGAFT